MIPALIELAKWFLVIELTNMLITQQEKRQTSATYLNVTPKRRLELDPLGSTYFHVSLEFHLASHFQVSLAMQIFVFSLCNFQD